MGNGSSEPEEPQIVRTTFACFGPHGSTGFVHPNVVKCTNYPNGYDSGNQCYLNTSKGLALIINNIRFVNSPELVGCLADQFTLSRLFNDLGYEVQTHTNITASEMHNAMSLFAQDSRHYQNHSAIVAIMSHGNNGVLVGSDDQLVEIKTLVSYLNAEKCPALVGKPKLLIFDACRGSRGGNSTDGFSIRDALNLQSYSTASSVPVNADFLLAYSTSEGYIARFKPSIDFGGGWFIDAICKVFGKEAYCKDVIDLFQTVSNRVAARPTHSGIQQVPEICSTLRKKFYLLPGLP